MGRELENVEFCESKGVRWLGRGGKNDTGRWKRDEGEERRGRVDIGERQNGNRLRNGRMHKY